MQDDRHEPWDRVVAEALARDRWRGVAELVDDPMFREAARGEFPEGADSPPDAELSRRGFLSLLGAGLALAGVGSESGCTRAPDERIVPYATQPPEVTPGVARWYATSLVHEGHATGVLVESHEGRPTKVEGNPEHPSSLGAAGLFEQAAVLQLYDPHRARALTLHGEAASWPAFVAEFAPPADDGTVRSGVGLHIVMEPTSSPWLASLLAAVRARWPGASVHYHSGVSRTAVWEGTRALFGRALEPHYDLARADVILALDADFLAAVPGNLHLARAFADRRRVRGPTDLMNRLYAVESTVTVTGMTADHRLRARSTDVRAITTALLLELAVSSVGARVPPSVRASLDHARAVPAVQTNLRWIEAVARDLAAHAGASVVIAGEGTSPEVQALAHALNAALGNIGRTVSYTEPAVLDAGGSSHDLGVLAGELVAGRVDTLWILGSNPVYTAPADLDFAAALRHARRSVYVGLYADETARACAWHVPAVHALEAWGDARAHDGTVSLVQPLIAPLYGGRTHGEVLAVLLGGTQGAHAMLRDFWRRQSGATDFDSFWDEALQRGFVPGTALPVVDVSAQWEALRQRLESVPFASVQGIEVVFRPDPKVWDGRWANNAWLQELPDPVTKLTWDNAALLSPATAARLGVSTGDEVAVTVAGRSLRIATLVLPGHADDSVTLSLGYGRRGGERLAEGAGSNVYPLRTRDTPWVATDATVAKTGVRRELALTQEHWSAEGRNLVREATLTEYRHDPHFATRDDRPATTLYSLALAGTKQWAMTIDLAVCTGCSACVVACQAENNVPVVGRAGVRKSREMHWLRIDRYFVGDARDPRAVVQPMACQHCEHAPCEYVCPVGATVHSPDGLNEQIYNRCVGTRFCSNNCPYKVRRFNFFNYNAERTETEKMVMNPDVTVRARGVMEKCSYCVQRIRQAGIYADVEHRHVRDGEVQTACQQSCPTRAITFGDMHDHTSMVAVQRRNDRTYGVLNELGTRPHTLYLARLRNANPDLERP